MRAFVETSMATLGIPGAAIYVSPELGQLRVDERGEDTLFRFVTFSSGIGCRTIEDGSVSHVTTTPLWQD